MVSKVAENLYTIPVPLPNNPLKSLNVYVVTGQRNLLIDTGFRQEECKEALLVGLEELNISMEDTDIFLTHLHSDHTGLAPSSPLGTQSCSLVNWTFPGFLESTAASPGEKPISTLPQRASRWSCWKFSNPKTLPRVCLLSPMTIISP